MVVSPAALAHDVSVRAGDVSMGDRHLSYWVNLLGAIEKLGDG